MFAKMTGAFGAFITIALFLLLPTYLKAADTYSFTDEEGTHIVSPQGEDFNYVWDADGMDWDGEKVISSLSDPSKIYKGPFSDTWNRYYIMTGGWDTDNTNQQIEGHLCKITNWVLYKTTDCSDLITIKKVGAFASVTYTYKASPESIVTSDNSRTFLPDEDIGQLTPRKWASSDNWRIELKDGIGTAYNTATLYNDQGAGVGTITINGFPQLQPGGTNVLSGRVYLKDNKTGETVPLKAGITVHATCASMSNVISDVTTLDDGTYKIDFGAYTPFGECLIFVDQQKSEDLWQDFKDFFEDWGIEETDYVFEGSTYVEFDRLGTMISGNPDLYLTYTSITVNVFDEAMKRALLMMGETISDFMGKVSAWIDAALIESTDIDTAIQRNITKNIRNLSMSLLTLALIIIAFANILNLQSLNISKMIPKLVIGVVMTYFSYLISIFLLEFMNALQKLILSGVANNPLSEIKLGINDYLPSSAISGAFGVIEKIPQAIIVLILLICVLLVFVWVWIVLIVRKAMLMILVALSPIAFIAMILPFTEKYYKQWWASFWKWAFMGPAIMLMMYLATQFFAAWGATAITATGLDDSSDWIYLIVFAVFVYLAAAIPMKMGNEIYGAIQKVGGKVAGATGLKARYEGVRDASKAYSRIKAGKDVNTIRNLLDTKGGQLGKIVAGSRGVFSRDEEVATGVQRELVKDFDQPKLEEELAKVTMNGTQNFSDPRAIALLEKISKEIHTGSLNDASKKALGIAVAQGSGLNPTVKSLQSVARNLEANPNKDSSQALYLHAANGNAATGFAAYAAALGPSFQELEKSAVKKASSKSPMEFSKDDDKTTEAAMHSNNADNAQLAQFALQQRNAFFHGPRARANKIRYDSQVNPKTRKEHEENGYRF